MSNVSLTLTTFTPAEAERITGLSTTMQRDWRRRGYLPANDGHARFDLFDLASMWSIKLLADRGIGPQMSHPVAEWAGAGIAWHALRWIDAYEGDHLEIDAGGPPPASRLSDIDISMLPDDLQQKLKEAEGTWGLKSEKLARRVFRMKGRPSLIPTTYLVWWADNTHTFQMSLREAFSDSSFEQRYCGASIVLDLNALGSHLIGRASRSFVHVEKIGLEA